MINNAGIVCQQRQESPDGFEMTWMVNYLSHFLLTLLLMDELQASQSARIVNVSSDLHRIVSLKLDDLKHQKKYSWWSAYGRSKLAQLYFTVELSQKLRGTSVTVNAVDPGP